MILFYSSQCNHCNMLLQTLKIHDKDKKIKLLSIDYLKSNNYKIDDRITHVPALLIINENRFIKLSSILNPNIGISDINILLNPFNIDISISDISNSNSLDILFNLKFLNIYYFNIINYLNHFLFKTYLYIY